MGNVLYPVAACVVSKNRVRRRFAGHRSGQSRPVPSELTPYPDGPYLLRGDFRLTGPDGEEIDPHRKTVALCRCGASRRKPFCDGTHKLIGFSAPGGEAIPARGRLAVRKPAA
jgi:CDGSH-type Zn-finger protein